MEKPLFLCDVALTHNLPDVWIEPAAGNGKRECETIETCTCAVKTGLGDTNLASVITPDLSKKIVGVRLAGNNLDNFTDGVNSFLMVVQDFTSPGTKKQCFDALSLASNYHTLIGGATVAEPLDIPSVQTTFKVQILTT